MKLYRNFMFPSFLGLSLQNRATATVSRGEKQTQTSGCMVSKNFTLTSSNSNGWHKSVQVKLPKHKKKQMSRKCYDNTLSWRCHEGCGTFSIPRSGGLKKKYFFFSYQRGEHRKICPTAAIHNFERVIVLISSFDIVYE